MRWIALAALVAATGCTSDSGKSFTDLGNGRGVPTETIAAYARQHSMTREQARKAMRTEIETREAQATRESKTPD